MTNLATASSVAASLGAEWVGEDRALTAVAPLSSALSGNLTFVVDVVDATEQVARALGAGAVVLFPRGATAPAPASGAIVIVDNPRGAFAAAVQAFFVPVVQPGISATAVVHETATIHATAYVGDFSIIGPGVIVGAHTEIRNHVVLAERVRLGSHVVVKSHAVVGEEGFGVDKDSEGNNIRLPHLGSVVVGDHVEIGNFTTVCSGTLAPTRVGDYTKIDDHVHVAHNCQIGANVIITACAELSGSVTVGDGAWLGPNASVIQGVTIGANALVGIAAVVTKSIPANEVQFGNPARRIRDNV
jgi:UDP-3-O-[3-hydroxymyristoyl] glucosamine N-acyltransferase LpxD